MFRGVSSSSNVLFILPTVWNSKTNFFTFWHKSQCPSDGLITHHDLHVKISRFGRHRTSSCDIPEGGKIADPRFGAERGLDDRRLQTGRLQVPSTFMRMEMNFILVQIGMSIVGRCGAFPKSGCKIEHLSSRKNLRPYIH